MPSHELMLLVFYMRDQFELPSICARIREQLGTIGKFGDITGNSLSSSSLPLTHLHV